MGLTQIIKRINVYKEFWKLAEKTESLYRFNNYEVDKLVTAWDHQLTELNFFYGDLVQRREDKDPDDTYFELKIEPLDHQLVYTQIGRGYPKELYDAHWCYVLMHCGTKLLVAPVTSIKKTSGEAKEPYEFDILEQGDIKSRLHFDDIKAIDKMRIIEYKKYLNVKTDRTLIENAFKNFLNIQEKEVDIESAV